MSSPLRPRASVERRRAPPRGGALRALLLLRSTWRASARGVRDPAGERLEGLALGVGEAARADHRVHLVLERLEEVLVRVVPGERLLRVRQLREERGAVAIRQRALGDEVLDAAREQR